MRLLLPLILLGLIHATAAAQRCTASSECTNTVPDFANRYCKSGTCSFRCRSGYTLAGSSCVATSTTTTTSAQAPTQTCAASNDCKNTVPSNANRYCNSGICSWRCRSGYVSTGSACVTTSSTTPTTTKTTSAPAATKTCAVSNDCAGSVIPENANNYCYKGCRSGFSLSSGACLSSTSTTTTSAAPSSTAECRTAADCAGAYPADSHRACSSSGVCTFACNDGYISGYSGEGCVAASAKTASRPAATQPAATARLRKTYQGESFFDGFYFLNQSDPTNGQVTYVASAYAFSHSLASVSSQGTAILSIDRTSSLSYGEKRTSVRIQSEETYEPGSLLLFDLVHVPVGPSVWPAVWTFNYPWPHYGEIDIYEGVNERTFNQMTLHTSPGCTRAPYPQTGSTNASWVSDNCDAYGWSSGCQVIDWDPASYGAGFNKGGGGVWAVLFAETGIFIWRFPRSSIPRDIMSGAPKWKTWGRPVAAFDGGESCDTRTYFSRQMITF
ncbi:hypothetical protein JCM10207_003879, partial [Rhodosporidiobolus poonsookiae]